MNRPVATRTEVKVTVEDLLNLRSSVEDEIGPDNTLPREIRVGFYTRYDSVASRTRGFLQIGRDDLLQEAWRESWIGPRAQSGFNSLVTWLEEKGFRAGEAFKVPG